MQRSEKQAQVKELTVQFSSLSAVFALDYRGLKVSEATTFRQKVRDTGAGYRVVKNTLLKRALSETPLAIMEPYLEGMTGLAFTESDPVSLAKAIYDFQQDVPSVAFKIGVVEDKVVDQKQFEALASLPSKEILQSKLLSVLQAPIRNLFNVMQAPGRDLVMVLRARSGQSS